MVATVKRGPVIGIFRNAKKAFYRSGGFIHSRKILWQSGRGSTIVIGNKEKPMTPRESTP